jgi:hypothetical protein
VTRQSPSALHIPKILVTSAHPTAQPLTLDGKADGTSSDLARSAFRALADTGDEATTTNHKFLLHYFQTIPFQKYMADASDRKHPSLGQGYLKVRCDNGDPTTDQFSMVHSWWTPTLPVTVLSPEAAVERHKHRFCGYDMHLNHLRSTGSVTLKAHQGSAQDITIPGTKKRLLLYTSPLVPGCSPVSADDACQISVLSARATRVLWHQRLGHCHARRISEMHQHVDGIPKIQNPPSIDGCDTCCACKMRKSARGTGDTRREATMVGQGISMDFGFIVQRSKDPTHLEKCVDLNGETDYLLIADHLSDLLWGIATTGKSPPLAWLNRWFAQFRPQTTTSLFTAMDEGGEMARNPGILALLEKFGYVVRPTAPDSSFQNVMSFICASVINHDITKVMGQ